MLARLDFQQYVSMVLTSTEAVLVKTQPLGEHKDRG